MATPAQLATWLADAEQALQDLSTGKAVASVQSPNGTVTFTASKTADLIAHINRLKTQIANGSGSGNAYRPIRFMF